MTPLHIRRYRPTDRTACLGLFEGNIPASFLPYEIPVFLEFLDCFTGPYLVVEEGEDVVACGGLAEHDDASTLCWGMVARDHQRRGIGRLLLRIRLGLAVSNPATRHIHMCTAHHTAPFFQREGFRTRQVKDNYYAPGLHRHDMTLRLGEGRRQQISGELVALQAAGHNLDLG